MKIEELNESTYRPTKQEKLIAIIEDLNTISRKSVEHSTRSAIAIIIKELEEITKKGK